VADYLHILERMDVVFIQEALKEDKLTNRPKSPKKLHFSDPFILQAVNNWIPHKIDSLESFLVESVVVTHVNRKYPTYYIKGQYGEVELAYIKNKKFWPIEVKWTNQIRPKDIKQISCYENGKILGKNVDNNKVDGVACENLAKFLYEFT
jgi:uncharacterized protein